MKIFNYFTSIVVLFAFITWSCESTHFDNGNYPDFSSKIDSKVNSKSKSDNKPAKVEICHYDEVTNTYVKLVISENGLNGHHNHPNDIINFDVDGDGYPVFNECGINFRADGLWDCDDTNANLNPETLWYLDADNDGYAVSTTVSCTSPGEGYTLTVLPLGDLDDNDSNVQDVVVEQNCFYENGVGNYSGTNNSIYGNVLSDLVVSIDNEGKHILTGTLTFKRQISPVDFEETVYNINGIFGDNWTEGPGFLYSQFSILTINDNSVSSNSIAVFNCNNNSLSLYTSIPGVYFGGAIQSQKI